MIEKKISEVENRPLENSPNICKEKQRMKTKQNIQEFSIISKGATYIIWNKNKKNVAKI